jgi:hypothetical protein
MELDEIDPLRWAALEAATDEYIALPATQAKFAEAAAALGLTQQVKREGAMLGNVVFGGRRACKVAASGRRFCCWTG